MPSWGGIVVVAVLLVLAAALGLWLRRREGRSRSVPTAAGDAADRLDLAALLPERDAAAGPAVVQISAAVCSPCRATARVWRSVLPDGQHVELDVEEHLDLASALQVWRTPTSFVLDGAGRLVARVDGVPSLARARAVAAGAYDGEPPSGADVADIPLAAPAADRLSPRSTR